MDDLYAILDSLDEDLQAMQEDLETAIELINNGEAKKAIQILEEMNNFLVDFLEPNGECEDEECDCLDIEVDDEDLDKEDEEGSEQSDKEG